jgi:hypothetical protein
MKRKARSEKRRGFMMKKLICLISTVAALAGLSAQAATLQEWNFYSDPAGKTLPNANNPGSATFSLIPGYDDSALLTDGAGNLISTHEDPDSTGMWTNGAILSADLGINTTSGTQYLRYDFSYDLSDTDSLNDSGCVVGFAFFDSISNKLAGVALQYNVGTTTSAPYEVEELTELTNTIGTVSVIAKIDLAGQSLDIWYSLTGDVSGFDFGTPMHNVTNLSLSSFDSLRFQATGDIQPSTSTDQVEIELLRTADAWANIVASALEVTDPTKYANEWTFERDAAGRPLSDTINSGTNIPLAQFDAGFGTTVFTSDRTLLCIGEDASGDASGVWTNGAVLDAPLTAAISGMHYLRYDVAYDLSSTNNDSGTLLGVYFTGNSGAQAAGLVLGYNNEGSLINEKPVERTLTEITSGLAFAGTLTAIAEVDLDADTLKVWYSVNGSHPTNYAAPNFTTSLTLDTLDALRFHATGDFRPDGSSNSAAVDNIRHAASWEEISEPPVDLTAEPDFSISVTDTLGGAMEIGETNLITVVISNSGGPATEVTSTLTHDRAPSAFSIISNNTPVSVSAVSSITNTYNLIANSNGRYTFSIQAISAETNSAVTVTNVVVGSQITYITNSITSVSGGVIPNQYEPGETLNITIVSANDGARTVSNAINTLSADPSFFTITPSSATYPVFPVGSSTSTVYTVEISSTTPPGTYDFSVTNRVGIQVWTGSFTLVVFEEGIPGISTNAITILVAPGSTASGSAMLTNSGNAAISYNVTDDGGLPVTSYTVVTQAMNRSNVFLPAEFQPKTVFTNWSGSQSEKLEIGFDMSVFGTRYNRFAVNRNGSVTLFATNGAGAVLNVFQSSAIETNSIRFLKNDANQLIIAWGYDTGKEFQAWLNEDGTIRYLYQYSTTWGTGTIGLKDSQRVQTITHTPGLTTRDSLLLSPVPPSWVSYTSDGEIAPQTSQALTFTADATGQPTGTNTFNATVNWGNGSNSVIAVTIIVQPAAPSLAFLSPVPFEFSGQAGLITTTNLIVTNNGNVLLNYTITDSGLQSAGYTWTNTTYGWQGLSTHTLTPAQLGTQSLNIGFPFVFFGNVYTSLIVNANGTMTLGSGQTISPFAANLSLDANAAVKIFPDPGFSRFTVIWENMAQSGGGSNQTFQAILNRDGMIRFNYKKLESGWTNGMIRLTDSSALSSVMGSLSNASTTVTSTNYVYQTNVVEIVPGFFETDVVVVGTNVVKTYTATANNQSLEFTPGQLRIISASPLSGTLPAGGTTNVLISGDARSLTGDGPNTVTNSTTLTFNFQGGSTNAGVVFIATNSADAAFSALSADAMESMWGADPVFTSQQNPDGSYLLVWPMADDGLSRVYKVWFSTNLITGWDPTPLATLTNGYSYVDTVHTNEPVIYYKVTVE